MRKFSILAAVLFVLLAFSVREASACKCEGKQEPKAAFENSTVVFIGVVGQADTVFNKSAELSVEQAWKPVSWNPLTVYNVKDCAVLFAPGERYLVYAVEKDGRLYTDNCNRTMWMLNDDSVADDLKFLQTQALVFIPETGLLSYQNLKIVLAVVGFILFFLLSWYLLDKFGFV